MLGSGSFLSTAVRSEVACRSAGIDWRRGFDPIDRSISVDSRTIFSSLIQFKLLLPHHYTHSSPIADLLRKIPRHQLSLLGLIFCFCDNFDRILNFSD